MNLSKKEAYITKKYTIKFGSDHHQGPFLILNPIKGDYDTAKSKLLKLLELNSGCAFEVKFGNGWSKWITKVGVKEDGFTNNLVFFNTYNEYREYQDQGNFSIVYPFENIEDDVKDYDINVRQVLIKGVH